MAKQITINDSVLVVPSGYVNQTNITSGTAWIENAQRTITTNGMIFGGIINNGEGE